MADQTVKVSFDGKEYEVPKGITVLMAAKLVGVRIPYFCWHKHLSISGNCRMCLVMVQPGPPKPAAACATWVSEGMKIDTTSDRVKSLRRGVLEFLLANHPLDCPVCEKAYECKLQSYTYEYGAGSTRYEDFHEVKRVHKRLDLGGKLFVEMNRCVNCTRCVRLLKERAGDYELDRTYRGHKLKVHTYKDKIDSAFAINASDICPVGALGDKKYRTKSRVWDLAPVPSVSGHSSIGCNVLVDVDVRNNMVARLRPRDNDFVNYCWMPDDERANIDYFTENRVTSASVRDGGKRREVSMTEGLRNAAEGLKAAAGAAAIVLSPRLTTEELWLGAELARALKARIVFTPGFNDKPIVDVHSDVLTKTMVTTDPYPNSTGGRLLGLDEGTRQKPAGLKLIDDVESGAIKAVLSIGEDFVRPGYEAERLRTALRKLDFFGLVLSNTSGLMDVASLVLPGTVWVEKAGTFICDRRRIQRIRKAVKPQGDALSERRIINGIAGELTALGVLEGWETGEKTRETFDAMVKSTPLFSGLTWDRVGLLGVKLGETGPEALSEAEAAAVKKAESKLKQALASKKARDDESQYGHD